MRDVLTSVTLALVVAALAVTIAVPADSRDSVLPAQPSMASIAPRLAQAADEADALCQQAHHLIAEDRLKEAEVPLQRCLDRRDQALGATDPQTLETVGALADLLFRLDRLTEAAGYYARLTQAADHGFAVRHDVLERARARRIVGG